MIRWLYLRTISRPKRSWLGGSSKVDSANCCSFRTISSIRHTKVSTLLPDSMWNVIHRLHRVSIDETLIEMRLHIDKTKSNCDRACLPVAVVLELTDKGLQHRLSVGDGYVNVHTSRSNSWDYNSLSRLFGLPVMLSRTRILGAPRGCICSR